MENHKITKPQNHTRYRVILWLGTFLFYAATTARDIQPADSGEFQLVAAKWGIAHPPGYPLYTIVGALWVRLMPLASIAFRANVLSAVLAATTLVLITEAARAWGKAWGFGARAAQIGGLAAALLLGSAATFWAQATVANIRMPTLLFTAWGFLALAHYRQSPTTPPLLELALALGLGVGHHPSLIFVAIGWAVYLLLIDPRLVVQPRRWWRAVPVAALAWLIPQLYLPARSLMQDVALSPGNLATWQGFWDHVLARGFGGDMFAFASAEDLALRTPLLPTLFRLQFPAVLLWLTGASWLWLLWKHTKLGLALFISWGIHTFVSITYRAPQTIEYLMPAYVPMALSFGLGTMQFAQAALHRPSGATRNTRPMLRLAFCALIIVLLMRFPLHVADFAALAADTSIRARTTPLLDAAPPDALILADWRWATPLWMLQQVEGMRPNVEIAYVNPEGAVYEDDWRALAEAAGKRPLLTTHSYAWDGWTFAPVGGGFRLYQRPLTYVPPELGFIPLEADLGSIRILGYRWTNLQHDQFPGGTLGGDLRPGRQVEIHLAWQASGPQDPPPSFTVRLWDADGGLLAQADRLLGSDTAPGEVRFTRLTLLAPIDRCSDVVYPTVGAYTMQDGIFQDMGSAPLAEGAIACDFPRLPTQHFRPGIVLYQGPLLRGIDYNYDVNASQVSAYVHWCGPGQGLILSSGEHRALVHPLKPGQCETVRLDVPTGQRPRLTVQRQNETTAKLLSLPLPIPEAGDRYVPFSDEMVLTRSRTAQRGGHVVLDLEWRIGRAIVDDYAVSARLWDINGEWIGMHDIQPGLGALPTLKWVVHNGTVLDSHSFTLTSSPPGKVSLTVYERFRMTPLLSPNGELTTSTLP